MAAVEHVRLAQSLHPRLLSFFNRFPPPQLMPSAQPTAEVATVSNTSPSDPNAYITTTASATPTGLLQLSWPDNSKQKSNPFLPFKNPRTGNWHGPHYSLRRQSELYRLAQTHNVLSLMPPSPKHPQIKDERKIERALIINARMREGLLPVSGKKAKGKVWERSLRGRLEERRKAMEGMPEMIRDWKQKGHGRGWRKWPK